MGTGCSREAGRQQQAFLKEGESVMAIRTCHRSMCHRRVEVNGKGDHKSLISPGKLFHERPRAESDHSIQ